MMNLERIKKNLKSEDFINVELIFEEGDYCRNHAFDFIPKSRIIPIEDQERLKKIPSCFDNKLLAVYDVAMGLGRVFENELNSLAKQYSDVISHIYTNGEMIPLIKTTSLDSGLSFKLARERILEIIEVRLNILHFLYHVNNTWNIPFFSAENFQVIELYVDDLLSAYTKEDNGLIDCQEVVFNSPVTSEITNPKLFGRAISAAVYIKNSDKNNKDECKMIHELWDIIHVLDFEEWNNYSGWEEFLKENELFQKYIDENIYQVLDYNDYFNGDNEAKYENRLKGRKSGLI
jgi:hypothetical protein